MLGTGLLVLLVTNVATGVSAGALFRLVLPVTAAGFLVFALMGAGAGIWAYSAMLVGSTLLDVVIWMALARISGATGLSLAFVFAAGRFAAHAGRCGGMLLGMGMADVLAQSSATAVITVCLVMMYALLTASPFMLERGREKAEAARSGADVRHAVQDKEAVCAALAQEYGLSPREAEVLTLLARGRSVPYIQEELAIAQSTAKTHCHRVYEKLGIHNKQELLSLIEARKG